MIRFPCPHCGHELKANDRAADKLGECPACQKAVVIPRRATIASEAKPAPIEPEVVFREIPNEAAAQAATLPDVFETQLVKSTWRPSESPERLLLKKWGRRLRWITWPRTAAAAGLLVAAWLFTMVELPPSTPAAPSTEELVERARVEGWERAKRDLLRHLKAPKTAEFPETIDAVAEPQPGEPLRVTVKIESQVDAQNSFGVPLRSRWSANYVHVPSEGTWELEYLFLGEDLREASPGFRVVYEVLDAQAKRDAGKAPMRQVGAWSGGGAVVSGPFEITRQPWRLTWRYFPDAPHRPRFKGEKIPLPTFSLAVHDARSNSRLEKVVDKRAGEQHESALIHRTGWFRLDGVCNGNYWVTVEEPAE